MISVYDGHIRCMCWSGGAFCCCWLEDISCPTELKRIWMLCFSGWLYRGRLTALLSTTWVLHKVRTMQTSQVWFQVLCQLKRAPRHDVTDNMLTLYSDSHEIITAQKYIKVHNKTFSVKIEFKSRLSHWLFDEILKRRFEFKAVFMLVRSNLSQLCCVSANPGTWLADSLVRMWLFY